MKEKTREKIWNQYSL